jgi:cytochrome c biogenesis protein CcdA
LRIPAHPLHQAGRPGTPDVRLAKAGNYTLSGDGEDGMIHDVSIPAALLAGLISFLSPCVLPLVPLSTPTTARDHRTCRQ